MKLVPQHGFESSVGSQASFRLDFAMPNFAYSVALAQLLRLKIDSEPLLAAVNCVSIAAVISSEGGQEFSNDMTAIAQSCAQLMRALLFFPVALRPILEEAAVSLHSAPANSLSKDTWSTLLMQIPFSDANDFRHTTHGPAHARIAGVFATRFASVWKDSKPLLWLHACCVRLVNMHKSSIFYSELTEARAAWRVASLCLEDALIEDYTSLQPEEGRLEAPRLPVVLAQAGEARLRSSEELDQGWNEALGIGHHRAEVEPNMSLHSPTLVLFFQSLLPWSELDRA